MSELMIEATDVSKKFGDVHALDGVSVTAKKGSVLGLLGHNGAGKTTLVNVLTTMLPPSAGSAKVAGFDVVRQSHEVRSRIGLTGQFAAVDEQLSGHDNLVLIARLPEEQGGYPLLVAGTHGKGRSLAWTSDIGPHWLPTPFVEWPGYARLWRQALAWLTSK